MSARHARHRAAAVLFVASIVAAGIVTTTAQAPQRDSRALPPAPPPTPAGSGAIAGTIVSGDTAARPLRLASVVIIGATTGTLRVTSSDSSGRFTFADLPADRYLIGASKPPFIGGVAGARRPARPGTPIVLAAGEKIGDLTIRLAPGAAISGVVVDERGEPAVRTAIAVQQRRVQGGERVLANVPGGATSTDDRGRYRVHSLPPGDYVVVAIGVNAGTVRPLSDAEVDAALKGGGSGASVSAPSQFSATYAPVYFPGTARESDAGIVTLNVGDERQNVDFRLELVRGATIEGRVSLPDGPPAAKVSVFLSSPATLSAVQVARVASTNAEGTFRLPNVPPGSYALIAREVGSQLRFASTSVEMSGQDQVGLQLTLGPPLSLAARIAFDGASPAPAPAGRRVPLKALSSAATGLAAPQASLASPAGTFTISGLLPGQYVIGGPLFFGASTDSVTWALHSVVADGRDVTDVPLTIGPDSLPKEVVVTYTDRWQELTGRLRQSSGAAASDFTIVVFPADKTYWLAGSRRILTARPGTDGQFRFGGQGPNTLPPGAYLLAAVTDLDRDEQFDPSFLGAVAPAAIPLTLQPGERKVQDVVIK